MTNLRLRFSAALTVIAGLSLAAAQPAQRPQPFEPVAKMLPSQCDFCHSEDPSSRKSGFYMGSYQALLDGAFRNGGLQPVILPGNAQDSRLVQIIEGRLRPDPVDHANLVSRPQIKAIREWIDQGARRDASTYEEHALTLPHVDVDPATHSFWLHCASRENGLDLSKRVKVIDEQTGEIVAYDWPDSQSFDSHGRWHEWKITVSPTVKGPVTVQLLTAGSLYRRFGPAGARDPADGSVFVLDPKRLETSDLDQIAAAVLAPNPPPHRTVELKFRTLTDADLALDVFPTRATVAVFHREERDLPPGQNSVTWTFGQPPPAAGWYEARFRFKARRPGTRQPDIGMTFEVTP
jgi:hypothetical protein